MNTDLQSLMNMCAKSSFYGHVASTAREFDDGEVCAGMQFTFPKQINLRHAAIVDQLAFVYTSQTLSHGGAGGSPNNFPLQADEHIVRVQGKYSSWGDGTIAELAFSTDQGRSFGNGRPTAGFGGYFEFTAKEGHAVCCLFGRADRYLRSIGFYTRAINVNSGSTPGIGSSIGKLFGR